MPNYRPAPPMDFTDLYGAKDRQLETQMHRMQLKRLMDQYGEEDAVKNAYKSAVVPERSAVAPQGNLTIGNLAIPTGGQGVSNPAHLDRGKTIANLMQINPMTALGQQGAWQQQDAEQQKQDAAQADVQKKAQHEKAVHDLEVTAQLAMPIAQAEASGAPPEQLQQLYTQSLQQAQQQGVDVSSFSPTYQPGSAAAHVTKSKELASELMKYQELGSKTVQSAQGVMQYNPQHGAYDRFVGKLPKTVAPAVSVSLSGAVPLSDPAVDQAASRYLKDGTLPPLGMGKQGAQMRAKILDRAAQLDPNADIAGNKASYQANSGSLKHVVAMRNSVEAFESTAGKNLDLFIETARKVPDTGIPILNAPARALAEKMGSENVSAYNTARQVALTEIAKVVNNPNLSGQLSDSARNEVMSFNPSSATLGQTLKIAQVLRADMKNRHDALVNQEKSIKQDMGGKKPQADPLGIF